MILVVIDTRTGAQRSIMVPVKAGRSSDEPAPVIAHPRIAQRV